VDDEHEACKVGVDGGRALRLQAEFWSQLNQHPRQTGQVFVK
jgi:hypothetical protein